MASVVIVLCLFIGCNILTNRMRKSRKIEIEGEPQLENENCAGSNANSSDINSDLDDPYESIDVNQMTHYDIPSENESMTLVARSTNHLSPEDEFESYESIDVNQMTDYDHPSENESLTLVARSMKYLHSYSVPNKETSFEGKEDMKRDSGNDLPQSKDGRKKYSDKRLVKTRQKEDSYLNPYNPLLARSMEYLHSYSAPTKETSFVGKEDIDRDSGNNLLQSTEGRKKYPDKRIDNTREKDDLYLNPYNPLLARSMGYLLSYSVPTKETSFVGKEDMKRDSGTDLPRSREGQKKYSDERIGRTGKRAKSFLKPINPPLAKNMKYLHCHSEASFEDEKEMKRESNLIP